MQLSWCANYRAYGRARNVNGDPNFFYKNLELLSQPVMQWILLLGILKRP
jgi:hypothetical protein